MTDEDVNEPDVEPRPEPVTVLSCTVTGRTVDGLKSGRTFKTGDFHRARMLRRAGLVTVKARGRLLSDGDLVRLIEGV